MSWSPSPPPSARKPARKADPPVAIERNDSETVANPARPAGPTRDLSDVHIDLFSTGVGRTRHASEEQAPGEQDVQGRVSMYVRIVDEMLSTVLQSDAYLFTPQEAYVLQHFKDLEYGPKYLLSRLLLRKTNKIFSVKEIIARYSTELGESYIPGYMDVLIEVMQVPELLTPKDILVDPPALGSSADQPHRAPQAEQILTEPAGLAASPKAVIRTPSPCKRRSQTPKTKPELIEISSDSDDARQSPSLRAAPRSGTNKAPGKSVAANLSKMTPAKVHPMFAKLETPVRQSSVTPSALTRARSRVGSTPRREATPARRDRAVTPEDIEVIEIMSSPPPPVASSSKLPDVKLPDLESFLQPARRESAGDKIKGKRPASTPTPAPMFRTQSSLGPDGKPVAPTEDDLESFYTYKRLSNLTSTINAFARGIDEMTVEDMIAQLNMAELVKIAKELKLWKSKYNRSEMIAVLLASANKQSRLPFAVMNEKKKNGAGSPGGATGSQQTTLAFSASPSSSLKTPSRKNSNLAGRTLLYDKIVDAYGGRAVQIALPFRSLIHRLNLVYYRSTITPSTGIAKSLMLPEILTSSSKRTYPDVMATRSQVWPSREALLEYESALEMEAMVDEALGEQNHSTGNWVGQSGYGFGIKGGRLEGARRVKRAWQSVHETWLSAVSGAQAEVGRSQTGSRHVLDRFELGHILTRVVSKGSTALGILHEYDQECEILKALLAQRVWRRGKRGAWYDRLALVLMNHYGGDEEKKREAVEVCLDGLEDPDTHLIYRPRLSRRLKRLEKQLELSKEERHICAADLGQPEKRFLKGHRIRASAREASSIRSFFANKRDEAENASGDEQDHAADTGSFRDEGRSSKTTWLGREGGNSVEGWVLEWWAQEGWKGFHAEASILTTLFTLLFWPLLYLPIPGAFETPYQLAPLDLGSDSFYSSRAEAIESRLADMQKTSRCLKMLAETDDRERPKGTLAVGLSWGFGKNDLEEIVQCLGGKALSVLCRMFCEEYGHRASGVPDLIVWNLYEKRARFVEVKSPNDHLSETQKVWINVLQTAGVEVEVCHVVEASTDEKSSLKGVNKRSLEADGSGPPSKRRRTPKTYDYGELGETDVDEEDEGGMEAEEWRHESGEEGATRSGKTDGMLLTRAQAQNLEDPLDGDGWSDSETESRHANKENRTQADFHKGTLLTRPRGGSPKRKLGPTKSGDQVRGASLPRRTGSASVLLCR